MVRHDLNKHANCQPMFIFLFFRYAMPHRRSLTETTVQLADNIKLDLVKDLKGATTVALTLDLWSNRRMQSFLGETAHYVTVTEEKGLLTLKSAMLVCR